MPGRDKQLHLALLGPPEARLGRVALAFATRKTLALLAYLAVERGEHTREHLAALLWPEASPARSHGSLRNTLSHLRRALRQTSPRPTTAILNVTHGTLALNPDAGLDLDLERVERAYAAARADRSSRAPAQAAASLPLLEQAANCLRGDFLAGLSLGDAPAFDDWAGAQREVWRRRLGLILDRLSEIQYARGEFASTADSAARWLGLDALNERAYQRKMRAHFAAGERGQALETYAACRALLAQELRAEPAPETEALAALVRAEPTQPAQPGPAPRPAPDTALAFVSSLFAGRDSEQARLAAAYERAAGGRAGLVTLHGESGIGKTHLADEFLRRAAGRGALVLRGAAFESGSHLPFHPLIGAVRPRLEPAAGQMAWLGAAWAAPLQPLLPELSWPAGLPGAAPAVGGPRRAQPFEALVRLLQTLAGSAPLALFVDDLQWADSATLEALQYAARRWRAGSAPVLLLVGVRPEALRPMAATARPDLADWLAELERELEPTHLALGPLSQADTLALLAPILAPPAAGFAQWLFEETRGQPFYLKETLKDLLERGVLRARRKAGGGWALAVDAEHDLGQAVRVPSTVSAVIRARLHRLSPNAFALLAAGAALEDGLTFERLCAIANVPADGGLPALDELLSSRLLLETAQAGGASGYRFVNVILREVVYTEAGDARRRLFHRRALETLTEAGAPAAVLAHHALAAGQDAAAVRYSLAAGQEALRLPAAREAQAHLEQARQLALEAAPAQAEFGTRIRDLYGQLGQAFEQDGQPEQAAAIYAELERLAADLDHPRH